MFLLTIFYFKYSSTAFWSICQTQGSKFTVEFVWIDAQTCDHVCFSFSFSLPFSLNTVLYLLPGKSQISTVKFRDFNYSFNFPSFIQKVTKFHYLQWNLKKALVLLLENQNQVIYVLKQELSLCSHLKKLRRLNRNTCESKEFCSGNLWFSVEISRWQRCNTIQSIHSFISGIVKNRHFNPTLKSQSIITINAPPLLSNAIRAYPANELKLLIIIILDTHIVCFSIASVIFSSLFIITQKILM